MAICGLATGLGAVLLIVEGGLVDDLEEVVPEAVEDHGDDDDGGKSGNTANLAYETGHFATLWKEVADRLGLGATQVAGRQDRHLHVFAPGEGLTSDPRHPVRTRPRAVRHSFNAQAFPAQKTDDALRVFVVGRRAIAGGRVSARTARSRSGATGTSG